MNAAWRMASPRIASMMEAQSDKWARTMVGAESTADHYYWTTKRAELVTNVLTLFSRHYPIETLIHAIMLLDIVGTRSMAQPPILDTLPYMYTIACVDIAAKFYETPETRLPLLSTLRLLGEMITHIPDRAQQDTHLQFKVDVLEIEKNILSRYLDFNARPYFTSYNFLVELLPAYNTLAEDILTCLVVSKPELVKSHKPSDLARLAIAITEVRLSKAYCIGPACVIPVTAELMKEVKRWLRCNNIYLCRDK